MEKNIKKNIICLLLVLFAIDADAAGFFTDDFESYSVISDANSNWTREENAVVSLDSDGGYGGSKAIKFTYSGQIFAPFSHSIEAQNLNEVYTKFKVKFSSDAVGGIKFLKLFGVITNGNYYANWTWNFGSNSSNPSHIATICFGNGDSVSNDTQICISPAVGVQGGSSTFYGDIIANNGGVNFIPTADTWYEVTAYNKYNTDGNADGEMWIAVDGVKILHIINAKNRNDADTRAIESISFGDYSNAYANIVMWLDDVEFSATPFGRRYAVRVNSD